MAWERDLEKFPSWFQHVIKCLTGFKDSTIQRQWKEVEV